MLGELLKVRGGDGVTIGLDVAPGIVGVNIEDIREVFHI